MNPIETGDAVGFQMPGDGFVRRQHELFNDAMGDVAFGALDAGHLARSVQFDVSFGHVEVDGAAFHPLAIEDERQFTHEFEAGYQRLIAFAHGGVAFQHAVDVGVSHALGAADDAAHKFLADHVAIPIYFKQRA